ncbi:50S ribosomal protein L14e [uncultured archaeon]|nr:50S ribosomal protein L14e [uncultured archaeon]
MFGIGRICVKIAGRDAGMKCVVVDVLDKNFVLIDGQTRRRKCNMSHLEPLAQKISIEKGASHEHIVAALKDVGIEVVERKTKAKAPARSKPIAKPVEVKPVVKPAVKKAVVKPTVPTG